MNERWKPKQGEAYYFFDSALSIESECYEGDYVWDEGRIAMGNCFKTIAEAAAASEKVKTLLLNLHEPTTECNQLPKLTAEVFDRENCPEWAKWAAVDSCGNAYFYMVKPQAHSTRWGVSAFCKFVNIGKFDASDWQNSLIERPEKETKLPEWCKVGEWVWAIAFNTYFKVDKVDGLFIYGTDFSGSEYSVAIENVRQACPRPYNAEEMKALVGKVIEDNYSAHLVIGLIKPDPAENVSCHVRASQSWLASDKLLQQFTIDGRPCGVLEHLNEKGEWVE